MTTGFDPDSEQMIIGCRLSDFLADRRQQILEEWMDNVRADPAVPAADELNLGQLKDHVPQLLDDLNQTLCDAFNPEIKKHAAWRAATHGHIRWEQKYDISQLIREIANLRTVLIYHIAEFRDERVPNLGGRLGLFATVVVHSFLDRLIRNSIEQFLATSQTIKHPDR